MFSLHILLIACLAVLQSQPLTAFRNLTELQKGEHPHHWFFLHYHKTGHDLSRHLGNAFNGTPCTAEVSWKFQRRVDARENKAKLAGVDIALVTANEMPFDWKESLVKPSETIKYVHFVRDPFDMVGITIKYPSKTLSQSSHSTGSHAGNHLKASFFLRSSVCFYSHLL